MPNFNDTSPNNQQPWHAYYCDNLACETDEEKNHFFLTNFLTEAQIGYSTEILGQGNEGLEDLLTTYRKITQFFLMHLPDMAFKLPGGGMPNHLMPLLQCGRVAAGNGVMHHCRDFRLLYTQDLGFVLLYSSTLPACEPNFYHFVHHQVDNPFINIHGLDPGIYLGVLSINNENQIDAANFPDIAGLLANFNADPNNSHCQAFINNWQHADLPYIPNLIQNGPPPPQNGPPPPPQPKIPTMINLNTILYGPPGTGKTYELSARAIKIINGENNDESCGNINKRFSELQRKGQIEFTTFHQNYAYEDFIEGLRAEYREKSVVYDIEPGILKRIAYRALYAWLTGEPADFERDANQEDTVLNYLKSGAIGNEKKPEKIPNYVLIIDEINRGNVARIFGELITLVEDSKRARRPGEAGNGHQPLLATLPYTKEPFIVPPNLYIIGTMNTADRSLIGLDAALRRRFFFEEMPPKPDFLGVAGGINLRDFLTKLNQKIRDKDTPDHCIGHAYFMEVNTLADLANVMRNKVIPQLQEYFHDSPKDLHQLLQFGNDSFVDQNGQTQEACLTIATSYQNFCAP